MPPTTRPPRRFGLDRVAIGLSSLCLLHCIATVVLVAFTATAAAGGVLFDSHLHVWGLAIAIPLGAVALGRGIATHGRRAPAGVGALGLGIMAGALTLPHGPLEIAYTIVGVTVLAIGHEMNRRAACR